MKTEFQSFPRDAKLYLVVQFLTSGYYTWPFWYGFASGIISPAQFGVYLAIGYIVGLLSEIPTGAFADRYGRKTSAIFGALCEAFVPVIVFIGASFPAYVAAAVVAGVGKAFMSGSLDSHLYELPNMSPTEYRRIMMFDTFFWQGGLIFSSAIGGFLFAVASPLPFIAQTMTFGLAAFVVYQMKEAGNASKESLAHTPSRYVADMKQGFLHLFRVRILWPLITFGSMVGVLMWMGIEYRQ